MAVKKKADKIHSAVGYITERKKAEEALRESEERYRTLFNAIDEGFCIVEVIFDANQKPVDYRFLEINPAFEKQTGLIAAKGKRMRELAPGHEEHWFETYGKIALTGQSARFQNRAQQLHRWYDVYAFRVGQPEDRQVAILFNDITERKKTEEELARLASYPELNPNPVIEMDDAGRVHYLNPAAKDLMGTKKPGNDHFLAGIPEALGEKAYVVREVKIGDYWYVQAIHNVPGSDRIRIYARDITDRKKAEEELAASEERHRAIFEQARDGIVLMDYESGAIVDCNAEYERQTGRKLEKLRKLKVWELRHPDQVETSKRMFGELKKEGELASSDVLVLRPDGGITPIDFMSRVISIHGKKFIQGITRDITDRKRAEEELNLYRQNLERMVEARAAELMAVNRRLRKEIANREKMEDEMLKVQKLESVGILAGGIAHDFNNVLTAIMNSVSTAKLLLKSGKESDKVLQTLNAALKTVRRATTMTYQLLTFAEGGEPVRKLAYVRNLIADTAEFSLRGSNVKCELNFADDLWPTYIDEGQVVQVVSNLVINAYQSMPEGGTVEVSAENVEVKVDDSLPIETGR